MKEQKQIEVGDRVQVIGSYGRYGNIAFSLRGKIGIVRLIDGSKKHTTALSGPARSIGVSFSRWNRGHALDSRVLPPESGQGWYFSPDELKSVDVKHGGKTYRVVRKGKKKAA